MRLFDRKFGVDYLGGVPSEPGIYRLYSEAGAILYVGKARNLRRRLAQYRTTRRTKKDRKRRRLVRAAARIEWEVCPSALDASLEEIRVIQALRPPENIAGAYPFLYPFIGIRVDAREISFCLTTSPEAFATFDLHGAYRSRDITGEAFFSLMRLLRFIGHPVLRRRRSPVARHSYVFRFRRLPVPWADLWSRVLRGTSREGLEQLSLTLLEHEGARARSAAIQADLRAIERFFDEEASTLAAAMAAAGFTSYPVPQRERDPLFLRYRGASTGPPG